MADRNERSNVIDGVEVTSDTLTSRAGLSFFSKYLSKIAISPVLERLFGSMRKSAKGQPVSEIFKLIFDSCKPRYRYKSLKLLGGIDGKGGNVVPTHASISL